MTSLDDGKGFNNGFLLGALRGEQLSYRSSKLLRAAQPVLAVECLGPHWREGREV
jgi:hypothetical protein